MKGKLINLLSIFKKKMSCCKECPICMDDILETNCVVTECGHKFHTSCLMKNVAHNGFGCPYCRTTLAEEVPNDNDDGDDYSSVSEEEEKEEIYGDYALRGMRWLFQRIQNEPLDEEYDLPDGEEEQEHEEEVPKPSAFLITQKLMEQSVTMEDLVKCMLSINHEEYDDDEELQQKEDEIFGKFRIIISNYRPNEENEYHRLYPRLPFPIQEERERQVANNMQQVIVHYIEHVNATIADRHNHPDNTRTKQEIIMLEYEAQSKGNNKHEENNRSESII